MAAKLRVPGSLLVLWRFRYYVLCAALVVGLWDTVWMKPFRVFVVIIHEACHAAAALASGGVVVQLRTHWDESGMTVTRGGFFPLISAAGYVGSALLGAGLIYAGRWAWLQRLATAATGMAVAMLVLLYTPPVGGDFYLGLAGGVLVAVGALYSVRTGQLAGAGLGVLLCLYSLHDFRADLWRQPEATDAGILARYWGMSWLAWPIAGVWVVFSLGCMYRALRGLRHHGPGAGRTA